MRIPLLDLSSQYRRIDREVEKRINKVIKSQRFILGDEISALEDGVSRYCGTRYGIGVASGSDAILLSLMAAGIGRDDTVVTTPYTFFSTAGSIALLGARPVFVDVEPDTFNIDPNRLEESLKSIGRAKAVIPVHLYGQSCDMDAVMEVAERFDLKVIEDAAQAIGAVYKEKMAGSIGDTGCISFFPTKNLGGFGDGGMVVTDDKELAERIRMLRVHGSPERYRHSIVGRNSRLDEIQAAVLNVKLKYLDIWTEERRENARRYNALIQEAGLNDKVITPKENSNSKHVYNQFVIRVKSRDRLKKHLADNGIGSEVYYPIPLHLQDCFSYLGYKRGDFPVAERASQESLALPVYPELKESDQVAVVSCVKDFYTKG